MDINTARRLSDLTTDFYRTVSASFSATRQAPWQGWQRVAQLAWPDSKPAKPEREAAGPKPLGAQTVLDLACGNLRFARFALERCPSAQIWAVDNCDELAVPANNICYQHLDIANTLLHEQDLCQAIDTPPCDLCVCFGFMHHVPLPQHRAHVLRALALHAAPRGLIAVSFWQFERDARIMAKAQPLPDAGDYVLGWQNRTDVQRYCHSFCEDELDALVQSVAPLATEVDRFSADGRSGDLNRYVVLRRTSV